MKETSALVFIGESALNVVCSVNGESGASLILPVLDVTWRWRRRAKLLGFGSSKYEYRQCSQREDAYVCGR